MQLYIMHSYDYLSCTAESMCIQQAEFNMFISFLINSKYRIAEVNTQDHLSYERLAPQPATSLQRSTQP